MHFMPVYNLYFLQMNEDDAYVASVVLPSLMMAGISGLGTLNNWE